MTKPGNTRSTTPAHAGPQRVFVITPRGRRRFAWLDPDGRTVDRKPAP